VGLWRGWHFIIDRDYCCGGVQRLNSTSGITGIGDRKLAMWYGAGFSE
jgi:hypothetical protein